MTLKERAAVRTKGTERKQQAMVASLLVPCRGFSSACWAIRTFQQGIYFKNLYSSANAQMQNKRKAIRKLWKGSNAHTQPGGMQSHLLPTCTVE